ncbi:hypothetical protein MFM001_46840 [Mycobacterium sp. MFM001]|nr:hypothetical protein MFM001_46840 [Mycobacterium sp. MFM001]
MSDTTVLIIGTGCWHRYRDTSVTAGHRRLRDPRGADDVGGTWRDNTYPGAACDVPSLLYSYSFEQNANWSRAYSGGGEILGYIKGTAEKHALSRFIRFGVNVTSLDFDQETGTWKPPDKPETGPQVTRASLQADLLAAQQRCTRMAARTQQLENRLSEVLAEQAWRARGLGAPTDIDTRTAETQRPDSRKLPAHGPIGGQR